MHVEILQKYFIENVRPANLAVFICVSKYTCKFKPLKSLTLIDTFSCIDDLEVTHPTAV